MSAQPISDPPVRSDVLVAQTVLDRLGALAEEWPDQADAVARAIQTVGKAKPVPIRIDLPDSTPGASYMALASADPEAPVIIYRQLVPHVDDDKGWLVTALLAPAEFRRYKEAEKTGLLDDPVFQALLVAGAIAGIIWLAGKAQPGGAA